LSAAGSPVAKQQRTGHLCSDTTISAPTGRSSGHGGTARYTARGCPQAPVPATARPVGVPRERWLIQQRKNAPPVLRTVFAVSAAIARLAETRQPVAAIAHPSTPCQTRPKARCAARSRCAPRSCANRQPFQGTPFFDRQHDHCRWWNVSHPHQESRLALQR
jgi:hypothetical protein